MSARVSIATIPSIITTAFSILYLAPVTAPQHLLTTDIHAYTPKVREYAIALLPSSFSFACTAQKEIKTTESRRAKHISTFFLHQRLSPCTLGYNFPLFPRVIRALTPRHRPPSRVCVFAPPLATPSHQCRGLWPCSVACLLPLFPLPCSLARSDSRVERPRLRRRRIRTRTRSSAHTQTRQVLLHPYTGRRVKKERCKTARGRVFRCLFLYAALACFCAFPERAFVIAFALTNLVVLSFSCVGVLPCVQYGQRKYEAAHGGADADAVILQRDTDASRLQENGRHFFQR